MNEHKRELLWSHYADSWKGIRLNFEVLPNNKLKHVHYFDKSDQITEEQTNLTILRKLNSWEYEKECRFIASKPNFYTFEILMFFKCLIGRLKK